VVGGDAIHPCISAASILAMTFRAALLERLDERYPGYGLAVHKGYGTREHLDALRRLGPSPAHRMTFRGVCPQVREKTLWLPGI
jgi:ribonuclease HII